MRWWTSLVVGVACGMYLGGCIIPSRQRGQQQHPPVYGVYGQPPPQGFGPTAPGQVMQPGPVVRASADAALSEAQLGAPYDLRFLPVQGPDGATLFPQSRPPARVAVNRMEHQFDFVESEEGFAANASAWGYGGFSADLVSNNRFATYRAMQIDYVVQLDDTSPVRQPPPSAVYYPWRIYYGRMYEVLFQGDARAFHAGVKANLAVANVDASTFAADNRLSVKVWGRGLEPRTNRAIFARTPNEIESQYKQTSNPVPIYAEFRQIPGRLGLTGRVAWQQPPDPSAFRYMLTFDIKGPPCDPFGGACDYSAYVTVGGKNVGSARNQRTSNTWDGWTPDYRFTAQEMQLGVRLDVWDRDMLSDDHVGQCTIQRGGAELLGATSTVPSFTTIQCGTRTVRVTIKAVQ